MPPSMKAKLCILALLPLAESSARPPTPQLADALADAHMVEPEVVARALREVIRIDHTSTEEGGWLADLRGFDGPERQELSDLLRKEGVGLADRSKLRRLATSAATQSNTKQEAAAGVWRRAQQSDGREESATNTQLKKQQGDHAGTAQPSGEDADNGSGLSADSALASLCHPRLLSRSVVQFGESSPAVRALMGNARRSNRAAGHCGPRRRGLCGAPPI